MKYSNTHKFWEFNFLISFLTLLEFLSTSANKNLLRLRKLSIRSFKLSPI